MSEAKAAPAGIMALLRAEIASTVRLAVLLGFFGALGPFTLVLLQMQVFALTIPTGSMKTAAGLVTGFAVVAVAVIALSHLRQMALLVIGNRMARRLAAPAVLAAAERGGEPAAAAAQAMRDIDDVRRGVAGPLCNVLLDATLVPMLVLVLAIAHWIFAVFALTCALLALLLGVVAERMTRSALAESNEASAQAAALVADAIRGAEAVEAMGLLPSLVRRWAHSLAHGLAGLRSAQSAARAATATSASLRQFATGGVLLITGAFIASGESLGYRMLGAMILTGRIMQPFGRLGGTLEEVAAARAAWRRLDALLRDAGAHTGPQHDARAFPCPEGRLVVERLTALQPGTPRPMLREVNLLVRPGDAVAVVGPAGCGKSTLMRLILGMQRPVAGGVFLDGHATTHWDREDLARHVGYLPQEPVLTEGTVAQAIARLAAEPDMLAVLAAARLVGADQMIAGLPQGFSTPVGGEFRLSMGQRQRIALARAVYGSPRLVLLDEPAAFLDAAGEEAVALLIGQLVASGTGVIFTSHRESLLRAATRVMTLRGGALLAAPEQLRLGVERRDDRASAAPAAVAA